MRYLFFICLAIVTLCFGGCGYHSGFTDRALQERLQKNQHDFNNLIQMLRADTTICLITADHVSGPHGIPITIHSARLKEYRSLMNKLQVRSIGREAGGGTNRVFFKIWGEADFPYGGTNEYLIYAETPPAEQRYVVESLDRLRNQTDAFAYKQISERWYLHVDNW